MVDLSKGVADVPEWFRGCHLNYAENLLRYGDTDGNKTAIITCGEYVFSFLASVVALFMNILSIVGPEVRVRRRVVSPSLS